MIKDNFKLYRFSPIKSEEELRVAIEHIHFSCYELCKNSFGKYLPNAGNIGIFCHDEVEFEYLRKVREEWCYPSENKDQKYFKLKTPIIINEKSGVPETVYTHLYIRKPDIYRSQVGDLDFYLPDEEYIKLKTELLNGELLTGARIFPRPDLDMIELYNFNSDVLAYVSTNMISEKVRVKLSEHTKL
jgi:hypothetical protein